jgi:hypothetical protein
MRAIAVAARTMLATVSTSFIPTLTSSARPSDVQPIDSSCSTSASTARASPFMPEVLPRRLRQAHTAYFPGGTVSALPDERRALLGEERYGRR